MERILFIISTILLVSGCATGPKWTVVESEDRFNDSRLSFVTTGDWTRSGSRVMRPGILYPVIVGTPDGPAVGLMSGGRHKLPSSTVQIRIDDNPAWVINPDETPELSGAEAWFPVTEVPGNALANDLQRQIFENTSRMMSPYTLATGEKAEQIIRQMISGNKLIYRQILLGQPNPSTGEVVLDESLREAVRKIGINF